MTYKFCPRCKKMIPHGLAYCFDCKPLAEQALQEKIQRNRAMRQKKYSSRRNSKYTKFYHSKDWKNLSRYKLEHCGYKCEAHLDERCTGVAVEVHHIKPIQTEDGWNLRLDWNNLEAVCTHCHNLRHPEKLKKSTTSGIFDMKKLL